MGHLVRSGLDCPALMFTSPHKGGSGSHLKCFSAGRFLEHLRGCGLWIDRSLLNHRPYADAPTSEGHVGPAYFPFLQMCDYDDDMSILK